MRDDDRPGHGPSRDPTVEPVVLPEHASAYYSPRSPPAETAHRTIEVVAVKLDASVDPRLADTQRVSIDGLQPPPWLASAGGSGSTSDAPTVLVPIVRARRLRRRALATTSAAIAGAALGAWFGLRGEARPSPAAAPVPLPSPAAAPSPEPTPAPSASARAGLPDAPETAHGKRSQSRRVASAPSAWFKAEPPKAWIK